MKVSKAIQLLSDGLRFSTHPLNQDARDALKLAIKSLERHHDRDYLSYAQIHAKLEGED